MNPASTPAKATAARNPHRRLVIGLTFGSIAMFGFGFALVPLYDLFCDLTGINGKVRQNTNSETVLNRTQAPGIDTTRTIKIQLIALRSNGMRWAFNALDKQLLVHPGQLYRTAFTAMNPTAQASVARAVPSVAPSEASQYLHKIQCFCFEEQALAAGASQQMPLLFRIDAALPDYIRTITLSYTLYEVVPDNAGDGSGVTL